MLIHVDMCRTEGHNSEVHVSVMNVHLLIDCSSSNLHCMWPLASKLSLKHWILLDFAVCITPMILIYSKDGGGHWCPFSGVYSNRLEQWWSIDVFPFGYPDIFYLLHPSMLVHRVESSAYKYCTSLSRNLNLAITEGDGHDLMDLLSYGAITACWYRTIWLYP